MLPSDPRIRSLLAQQYAAERRGQAKRGPRRGGRSLLSRRPTARTTWPARTVRPSVPRI